MSERSDFMLGQYIFIKVVSLTSDQGVRTARALVSDGILPPFTSNEFLINHLISRESNTILSNDMSVNNSLLSPRTTVLVSGQSYNLGDFNKYSTMSYDDTVQDLLEGFSTMDSYLKNLRNISARGKTIRTALIISKIVTGNYDDFLKKHKDIEGYDKVVLDSLVHISYLYYIFQNRYQVVHGDPKVQNYTWLELDTPIDIEYDFRDEYDSDSVRIIRRKGVKHLFYLTDLEFVYSSIVKTINIDGNIYYYNFKTQAAWYGEDNNDDRIYVPKITKDIPYQLNFKLYGGYNLEPNQPSKMGDITLYDWFEPIFPRMFSIDLLTFVKMLLTYWYADSFDGDILRKLNIYFTQFVSLSFVEENPRRRDQGSYLRVSPGTFAVLVNSD